MLAPRYASRRVVSLQSLSKRATNAAPLPRTPPPCFTHRYPALVRAMYGLLMLLPQGDAFKTLHARLHGVPTLALLQLEDNAAAAAAAAGSSGGGRSSSHGGVKNGGSNSRQPKAQPAQQPQQVDFGSLLQCFVSKQEAHARSEERRQALVTPLAPSADAEPGWDNALRDGRLAL